MRSIADCCTCNRRVLRTPTISSDSCAWGAAFEVIRRRVVAMALLNVAATAP